MPTFVQATGLQLPRQTSSSCYFKSYNREKMQTLSVQFRQPKTIIRKQYEQKKRGTICGNIVGILHEVYSPIAEEGGCLVCGGARFSQYNDKNCFHYAIIIPMFPVWAIYRLGAEREWKCLKHNGWILAVDGWSLLCLARYKRIPVWACWRNALPLGNNTTTLNFLMPPTHMCTFFLSSKQELFRGNGFLWLK